MPIDVYNDPHGEARGELIRRINQAMPGGEIVKPGKALALTADNKVVDADDPAAEFVLCGENGSLPADVAKDLGIKEHKRTPEQEAEAQARIDAGKGNIGPAAPAQTEGAPMQTETPVQFGGVQPEAAAVGIPLGGEPAPADTEAKPAKGGK